MCLFLLLCLCDSFDGFDGFQCHPRYTTLLKGHFAAADLASAWDIIEQMQAIRTGVSWVQAESGQLLLLTSYHQMGVSLNLGPPKIDVLLAQID